jgi:hypothetical protein
MVMPNGVRLVPLGVMFVLNMMMVLHVYGQKLPLPFHDHDNYHSNSQRLGHAINNLIEEANQR